MLRMAPIVTGGACLVRLAKESSASHLKLRVTHQGETSEWCLTGGGTLPSASAVAEQGGVVTQHSWKPAHFPWPLWFVKRVADVDQANCSFEDVDTRCVSTYAHKGGGDPFADNCDVILPVLVNTKALDAGEELRVLWVQKPIAKVAKTSTITWASQARVKMSKLHQKKK